MGLAGERERKRSPHRCDCGQAFEVCYYDDRLDPSRDGDPVTIDIVCPGCSRSRTFSVPAGADRTVVVEAESDHDDLVDEGGGG